MDMTTIDGIELIECGECAGCKAKQEQTALLKQMDDEWFMPRVRQLSERYDQPDSQIKPEPRSYEARAILRERDAVLEYRSRVFTATLRDFGYPSCSRLIIRATRAA